MVTVFLRGGLGNQMFEYALGLHLAKKNRAEVAFDTVFLHDRFPRRNFAYREYDLDVFMIEPKFTGLSRAADSLPIPGVWLAIDFLGIAARTVFGEQKFLHERTGLFDPAVLEAAGNILLYGRWQSVNYFKDIEGDIRRAFTFRHPLDGEAARLAEKIGASNSVSLHVRRGDYATNKNVEEIMGRTDLAYYDRAARYVAERVKAPQFFVFSDDVEWCLANLKLPFPATFVPDAAAGPKSAFHLELMSRCKHNVITNSTFSWWGAWLNANPQKIVIAPKQWYHDPAFKEDIVPEGWVRT